MNIIPRELVETVRWEDHGDNYDLELSKLGGDLQDDIYVVNPLVPHYAINVVDNRLVSMSCIVWTTESGWLVKKFPLGWKPDDGWQFVEVNELPCPVWTTNTDVSVPVMFENDPLGEYEIPLWDLIYEHVWYIDPAENKTLGIDTTDKVWIYKLSPPSASGLKDMGELTPILPVVTTTLNPDLPDLFTVDYTIPYWDLQYDHVWHLDPIYYNYFGIDSTEKVWVISKSTSNVVGTKDMGFLEPNIPDAVIEYNTNLPEQLKVNYVIPFLDKEYKHVWYVDPSQYEYYNIVGTEKVWAVKMHVEGALGEKDMGTLFATIPETIIEYNPDLPEHISVDYSIRYLDNSYTHIWYIDPAYYDYYKLDASTKVWAVKMHKENSSADKDMGYVAPPQLSTKITYNSALPEELSVNYNIPYADKEYSHVWYLSPTDYTYYGISSNDKVWAVSLCATDNPIGVKDMGFVKAIRFKPKTIVNPALPENLFEVNYEFLYHDREYDHVWYIDPSYIEGEKVWAVFSSVFKEPIGVKDMGTLLPKIEKQLDVVFISYDEVNAEDNWTRLLTKVPKAKRVDKVSGIFEAHKEAAKVASTGMFYVVDGDAWIVDDFDFTFNPNLFNRDSVHVFRAKNPINDLVYGYGGVKLFPKTVLLEADTWKVDMTTSISNKLTIVDTVSNVTAFNTDPFSTWRSAFRECAKLASSTIERSSESAQRLDTWLTVGKDRLFGEFAIAGALAGKEYGIANKDNAAALKLINDRNWLKKQFTT